MEENNAIDKMMQEVVEASKYNTVRLVRGEMHHDPGVQVWFYMDTRDQSVLSPTFGNRENAEIWFLDQLK